MVTLQVVFLSILTLALSSYISKKSLVKPGVCPKKIGGVAGGCISDCRNDNECPGDKKCCRINECATYCTMPISSDVGNVRSAVILDDTNTVFGARSSLNGIGHSRNGIRTDNVESSRRFTQSGGRTSTTFKTGIKGKANSVIGTQRGRSGFDDIGFTRDIDGNLNDRTITGQSSRGKSFISKSSSSSSASNHMSELEGIRSGLRGLGSVSGTFESADRGMGHATGMNERNFIDNRRGPVMKSSGGRVSSVVDTFDLQRDSGIIGIRRTHGTGERLLGQLNGDRSTRGRSFNGNSAVGMTSRQSSSSTDCHYECGKTKPCPVGKHCVQDGCHNICQIDVLSVDQSTSLIDNMGRSIIRSSQGEFGTRRSSVQESSSILDGISGRSGGMTRLVSETGISGLTQNGRKKICRKQCQVDGDCRHGKICVTVNNCHMYCRKGPVKNNYKP